MCRWARTRPPARFTAGVNHRMIRADQTRRVVFAALATISFLITMPAQEGLAEERLISRRVCDYDWRDGTWQLKQLIKCAARRWDSPGAPDKAIEVARCESNLNPRALNPNGYGGLFQQALHYWPGRADRWGQPDRSVYNGRANIIVSLRMAAAMNSWSAWAGCA